MNIMNNQSILRFQNKNIVTYIFSLDTDNYIEYNFTEIIKENNITLVNMLQNKLINHFKVEIYFPLLCKLKTIDNNDISNLRLLCPNCHSQTDTYTGRNCKLSIRKRRPCDDCKINNITEKNKNGICKSCRKNNIDTKSDSNSENSLNLEESFNNIFLNMDNINLIVTNVNNLISTIIDNSEPIEKLTKCSSCSTDITKKSKHNLCPKCAQIACRVVERPPYETLLKEIDELGYLQTGKKYGVSDNAIRKWVRNYQNLPTKPSPNNL